MAVTREVDTWDISVLGATWKDPEILGVLYWVCLTSFVRKGRDERHAVSALRGVTLVNAAKIGIILLKQHILPLASKYKARSIWYFVFRLDFSNAYCSAGPIFKQATSMGFVHFQRRPMDLKVLISFKSTATHFLNYINNSLKM